MEVSEKQVSLHIFVLRHYNDMCVYACVAIFTL